MSAEVLGSARKGKDGGDGSEGKGRKGREESIIHRLAGKVRRLYDALPSIQGPSVQPTRDLLKGSSGEFIHSSWFRGCEI